MELLQKYPSALYILSITLHSITLRLVQSSSEVTFFIPEEQEEGTYIGSLNNNISGSSPLQYNLLHKSTFFYLDKQTGDLYTTANRLDRESLCPFNALNKCFVEIDAFISSEEHSEIAKIKIYILDINDHAPYFTDQTILLTIPEDAAIGSVFPIDHIANDPDAEQNSLLTYHLYSIDGIFTLGKYSELLSLIVQKPLDRESQSEYHMDLIASDSGRPPLSCTALIIVQIMDVNDNCPVFLTNNIYVNLTRNCSVNSTVTQLIATDEDTGENGIIQYVYSYRVPTASKNLFQLESMTGILMLSASLQEDIPRLHRLTVLAIGPGCAPALAVVTVEIQEFKRTEPHLEIRLLASQEKDGVSLREDVPLGTIIAIIEIKDPDESILRPIYINGTLPFSLKVSESSPDTYLLLVNGTIDFELEQNYIIQVFGNNIFNNSTIYQASLSVNIDDANDNSPQFPQKVLEVFIEENNSPGAFLLQLSVLDRDSGINSNVTYSFGYGSPMEFSIDVSLGILTASVSLDREKAASYILLVVATDLGLPARNGTCTVIVNILDQNDNAPLFPADNITFFVSEGLPRHGKVGIINVTDADFGLNGDISVHLLNSTAAFSIDQNFIITSENFLDYESDLKHELWIEARDKGNPPMFSTVKVNVVVLDVNDNAPLILLPDSNFSYVLVPPDTSKGSAVAKVHAVDYDAGMNGVIRYSGFGEMGQLENLFSVDDLTGNITLKESTSGHHCGLYQFLVKASDQGYPEALSTIVRINILLNHSISNRSYLESVIKDKESITIDNQVILLSPCTQYQKMTQLSWSLTITIILSIIILSAIFFVIRTIFLFCIRKRNTKRKKKTNAEIPLKLNNEYYRKDWEDIK